MELKTSNPSSYHVVNSFKKVAWSISYLHQTTSVIIDNSFTFLTPFNQKPSTVYFTFKNILISSLSSSPLLLQSYHQLLLFVFCSQNLSYSLAAHDI